MYGDENITIAAAVSKRYAHVNKQLSDAQSEMAALDAIRQAWPATRLISRITYIGGFAELGSVKVRAIAHNRQAAADYLTAFDLEPLVYIKGTFASIRPDAWRIKPEKETDTIITDIWPVIWEFENNGQYVKPQLRAFTTLADQRIDFAIDIHDDPAHCLIRRDNSNVIESWELRFAPGGEVIKYASGSPTNAGQVRVYFPHEAGAAPTVNDFLEGSQTVVWKR